MLPRAYGASNLLAKIARGSVGSQFKDSSEVLTQISLAVKQITTTSRDEALHPDVSRQLEEWDPTPATLPTIPSPVQSVMPKGSRRSGVIAVKAGMTQEWDEWGKLVPLTILWIDDCEVVQTKIEGKERCNAVQLGCGAKRPKQLNKAQLGHFKAAGVDNKRRMAEFRVTADGLMPPKTKITAAHFVPGQFVDIQGTTIGKGFQGVMKKHGFAGQPASHGNSKAHRLPGSVGQCQDPGKIFPGKKMAGRMGNETRTVLSALLYKMDPVRNLLYVRGQVPGHKGNFVLVKDAAKKTYEQQPERPFPTHLNTSELTSAIVVPKSGHNPFERRER